MISRHSIANIMKSIVCIRFSLKLICFYFLLHRHGRSPQRRARTQTTRCYPRLWSAGLSTCLRSFCHDTCRSSMRSTADIWMWGYAQTNSRSQGYFWCVWWALSCRELRRCIQATMIACAGCLWSRRAIQRGSTWLTFVWSGHTPSTELHGFTQTLSKPLCE